MSYCASLPFFEREILPYLQQVGDGRVTVLLDRTQYDASFSDFVRGAGTKYRIHAVRLPHKFASFHPKLYLLMGESKAELLVSSGNLTPSGFRSNAEVVDRLALAKEDQTSAGAFGSYAAMLRMLPKLDSCLPEQLALELEKVARAIEGLRATTIDGPTGPWFLHTIDQTLLAQVERLIAPRDIRQITAISPFFDAESLAVLKLAEIYKRSKIRLIKDSQPDSLNGIALKKLGGRITVEQWGQLADEEQRRLHAKLLMLRSDTHEWVVSGSANLTRAAWLSCAMSHTSAGNVEAVVVRRFGLGSTSRLLTSLCTTKVDHGKLSPAAIPTMDASYDAPFTIIDSGLSGNQMSVFLEAHEQSSQDSRFRLYLEQNSKRFVVKPHTEWQGSMVRLTASVEGHRVDREQPIIATVESVQHGRQTIQIRAWVNIRGTLQLSSTQRNIRGNARDVCRTAFPQDEAAGVIGDAITRFLTNLGGLVHQGKSQSNAEGTGGDLDSEIDPEVSQDDSRIDDSALGVFRAGQERTAKALTALSAVLAKLLLAADHVDEADPPADPVEEEQSEEQENGEAEGEPKRGDKERKKRVKQAEELLAQLDTGFRSIVDESLQQEVTEQTVRFLLNLPAAAIAYVLLHAQIRRRLEIDTGYKVTHDIRRILRKTLSIDGIALGRSYGWLVRAWASQQCRAQLDESLLANGMTDELIAFVAAGLAISGLVHEGDSVAQGILAGLHLITGRSPGASVSDHLLDGLTAVSLSSGGVLGTDQLCAVIASFAPEKSNLLSYFRCWRAMKAIDAGHVKSQSAEGSQIQLLAPELWAEYCSLRTRVQPALSQGCATDNGVECGACHMMLPNVTAQRLADPPPRFTKCDYCHRILIPMNLCDGISERVVSGLESMIEEAHA